VTKGCSWQRRTITRAAWSKATRQHAIDTVLRHAMIEIRALAYTPDMASHPTGIWSRSDRPDDTDAHLVDDNVTNVVFNNC
jgi:hypothetical protein